MSVRFVIGVSKTTYRIQFGDSAQKFMILSLQSQAKWRTWPSASRRSRARPMYTITLRWRRVWRWTATATPTSTSAAAAPTQETLSTAGGGWICRPNTRSTPSASQTAATAVVSGGRRQRGRRERKSEGKREIEIKRERTRTLRRQYHI